MNISDLLCTSILHVIGTWFAPKGTGFWSAGNEHTCDMQGWSLALFYQYALVYNAACSIVFLLIVRYSWNEEDFRKWSYVILCSPPVLVTLLCIPFLRYYKYMNYAGSWICNFVPSPPRCNVTPGMECNEDNPGIYTYYQMIRTCVLLLSTSIIIYACVRLFLVARRSDESMLAYRSSTRSNYATSNRVAVSGLFYSGGNLLVVLPVINYFIGNLAKVNGASFFLDICRSPHGYLLSAPRIFECPGIFSAEIPRIQRSKKKGKSSPSCKFSFESNFTLTLLLYSCLETI